MRERSSCNTIQSKARVREQKRLIQGGSENEHLCQGAIDAQGASYGLYSFWMSDKFSLFIPIAVVAIIFIMPANFVV